MNNIPLLGWILIGFVAVMTISLNVGLLLSLRQKKSPSRRRDDGLITRMGHTLRNPWEKEDNQLNELAQRANLLRRDQDDEN